MKNINCCSKKLTQKISKHSRCLRNDKKLFVLPRKFTRKQCKQPRGFSMKSSCAPYKYCQNGGTICKSKHRKNKSKTNKKKQFLFNPNDPSKSFDVYIDKDPSDTIPIKYTTIDDVKHTIQKLERLYKQNKYNHKRIWQVGMILMVRLKVLKKKKPQHFKLANKYFKFLKKRTKTQKDKRKSLIFKI